MAAKIVPRFSTLAVGSVALLLAGGVVGGYLEVKAWRGLWETTYGALLLAKVGIILPLLALGAYNNRYAVPRLRAEIASAVEQRRFLKVAGAEVALFLAALGVTAVLVQEAPAKTFVAPTGIYATTSQVGPFELNLTVDPARAGPNEIHLYLLGRTGQPASVSETTLRASLPGRGIGPLRLQTQLAGPGHYVVPGAVLPLAASWRLEVTVRRGDFDEWRTILSIPIRGG
jgi:copper transport protein